MKTFERGNWDNTTCPMCNTKDDGEVILVPIAGTSDGNISEAIQIHLDCIIKRLIYYPELNLIGAKEIR